MRNPLQCTRLEEKRTDNVPKTSSESAVCVIFQKRPAAQIDVHIDIFFLSVYRDEKEKSFCANIKITTMLLNDKINLNRRNYKKSMVMFLK